MADSTKSDFETAAFTPKDADSLMDKISSNYADSIEIANRLEFPHAGIVNEINKKLDRLVDAAKRGELMPK